MNKSNQSKIPRINRQEFSFNQTTTSRIEGSKLQNLKQSVSQVSGQAAPQVPQSRPVQHKSLLDLLSDKAQLQRKLLKHWIPKVTTQEVPKEDIKVISDHNKDLDCVVRRQSNNGGYWHNTGPMSEVQKNKVQKRYTRLNQKIYNYGISEWDGSSNRGSTMLSSISISEGINALEAEMFDRQTLVDPYMKVVSTPTNKPEEGSFNLFSTVDREQSGLREADSLLKSNSRNSICKKKSSRSNSKSLSKSRSKSKKLFKDSKAIKRKFKDIYVPTDENNFIQPTIQTPTGSKTTIQDLYSTKFKDYK